MSKDKNPPLDDNAPTEKKKLTEDLISQRIGRLLSQLPTDRAKTRVMEYHLDRHREGLYRESMNQPMTTDVRDRG